MPTKRPFKEIQYTADEYARPYFTTTAKQDYYIDEFMKCNEPFVYDDVTVQAILTITNSLVLGIEVSDDGDGVRYVWIGGRNE